MASLTGFFSQQLVQFETCLQRDHLAAVSSAKTNNYTAHGIFVDDYNADEFGPMVAAIHVGLIQPCEGFSDILAKGCTSGNCTFPAAGGASISTIGIGHLCEEVSNHIRHRDGITSLNGRDNSTVLTVRDDSKTVLVTNITSVVESPLSSMTSVVTLFRQRYNSTDFRAVQCSLFPTVDTYGVNITNSIIMEQLVERVPMMRNHMPSDPTHFQDYDIERIFSHKMVTESVLRNGSQEVCGGSRKPEPGRVKVSADNNISNVQSANGSSHDTVLYYPADCVWSFGMGASSGIDRSLQTIFHDQELIWGGRKNTSGSVHLRALFQPGSMSRGDHEASLHGDISFYTIDNTMANMTKAMTAVVRTNGYEHSQGQDWYAYGDMWHTTTCVRVQWEWITFPVIMLGLAGAFLLLVVIETRDVKSDRLWKSSVLAALFCDVEVRQDRPIGKERMLEIARSTSVSLEEKNSDTLRLTADRL